MVTSLLSLNSVENMYNVFKYLMKKLVKCYVWCMALYGAETWTLRATDQKHLESFEM